mgnify:CR=1 FL=1
MSMTLSKTIQLPDLLVTVRELTVGEIRAWMKRTAEAGHDPVDDTLLQEVSLADLYAMTDLQANQAEEFPCPLPPFRLADALHLQAEGDIVEHAAPGQQGVMLEHHAALRRRPCNGLAVHPHGASAGRQVPGQGAKQG